MRLNSKRMLLALALASALPLSAQARTPGGLDDRWYGTVGAGYNHQDSSRDTSNEAFGTLGVGKFVNENWSVDAELNYQNPHANSNKDLNFSQYGISVDARRHFRQEGRTWNPYVLMGVGYQRAEEEYVVPNPSSPAQDKRGYATAKLGLGAQGDFKRVSLRGEIAARGNFDRDSVVAPNENHFIDGLAQISLIVPLGAERVAQVAPPPAVIVDVPPSCSGDRDGDGVDDCVDQCPDSTVGQTIGENGCPVAVTIDLRGVNFEFDRSTLDGQSTAVLDEAVSILQRYPDLRVEVAGHTDSIGSESYNQGLSERRADAVYQYLIGRGVDQSRLSGPNGYGETRPIAPNDSAEGRAKNRRTELNVEN